MPDVVDDLKSLRISDFPRDLISRIALKIESTGLSALDEAITDPALDAETASVLKAYCAQKASASEAWISDTIVWLAGSDITPYRQLRLLSDVAWAVRETQNGVLSTLKMKELVAQPRGSVSALYYILYLQAARFDFRFQLIVNTIGTLSATTKSYFTEYFRVIELFAIYGLGGLPDRHEVESLAEDLKDGKLLHALAHGLWFSSRTDDSEILVLITNRLLAFNPQDVVASYRQAAALRRLERYSEARKAINNGLQNVDFNNLKMNGDLIEEQQRIILQEELVVRFRRLTTESTISIDSKLSESQKAMRIEVQDGLSSMQKATSDALFSVVEILGLFTAIIALLATALTGSMANGMDWWQRPLIILSGALGSLAFFIILRKIVRPSKKVRRDSGS